MIARLEADISGFSQRLCDKLLAQAGGGGRSSGPEPFDVAVAYSNLATDVISGYCFGENFGLLAQPGWHPNFRDPTSESMRCSQKLFPASWEGAGGLTPRVLQYLC